MEKGDILKEKPSLLSPDIFIKKLKKTVGNFGKREGPYIKWIQETYDDSKHLPYEDDLSNGHPTLNKALLSFDYGVMLVAAPPNHGKSSLAVNMITQSLTLNSDLRVLDFTFDDDSSTRFLQYLCSMTGLSYNQINLVGGLTKEEEEKVASAVSLVEHWIREERLKIYDNLESVENLGLVRMRFFKNLLDTITKTRERFPEDKIVTFVDSWHDLDSSDGKGFSEVAQANYWTSRVHDITNTHKVPIVATTHLRKFEGIVPTLEDVKGSSNLAYEARVVFALVNESKLGHFLEPISIFHSGKKYPAILLRNLKSKVSDCDGDIFYGLIKDKCQVKPVLDGEYRALRDILSQKKRETYGN